jgi:hypothetical protein
MEYDEDAWFPGKYLDDYYCDHYALVIWQTFNDSECETKYSCIDVEKIRNPLMFTNPKVYGLIRVNVVEYKGYKLGVFEQLLSGRVLTTGGKNQIFFKF